MKQTYFNIPGWFNYSETYDIIVDKIPNDGVIVEIGSFLGRSTHYLATSLMLFIFLLFTKVIWSLDCKPAL